MEDMGEGEATLAQSSRLLGLRPGAKKESICVYVCVRACMHACASEREGVCVRASACVFPKTIPCVCMHVFVKQEKKWEKNLNNKCFICFKKKKAFHTKVFYE